MKTVNKILLVITYLASILNAVNLYGQQPASQSGNRISIKSIRPNISTGQNYSPWLNDDLNDLVQNEWSANNLQYVDVTLNLSSRVNITGLSLYDHEGTFSDLPVSIYALSGTQRTLLGVFTGQLYLQWVDILPATPVKADAIIIRKYGNNIPKKIKIYGRQVQAQSTIHFAALASKKVGDAPFDLVATSNNNAVPVTFTSSNPAVVSVSNTTGRWRATIAAVGSVTITATQAGNASHLAAHASQLLTVQAATSNPSGTTATSGTGKIPIDPLRWYQLTNSPDGIPQLFDGVTSASVTTGWGKMINTYDSYYPLQAGESFAIESIRFFDGSGINTAGPLILSIITNTWQRVQVATFTGELYQQWVGPYPNRPATLRLDKTITNARYLVVTSSGTGGYPTEIELYGSYTMPAPTPLLTASALARQKQIKLRQSFGVNAFEWDLEAPNSPTVVDPAALTAVKNFTGIRHYLDWEKLESTEGSYTFNPTPSGGWNFDAMYSSLKQEGIEVLVCLKTSPNWLQATWPAKERDAENVPVRYGRNFAVPASYIEQAKVAFQFVARYGYNPNVNSSLLSVSTAPPRWTGDYSNQLKVGLGLIKYIECDNERDKWWKGRKAYQTAAEYAANLSAFYDGHKNTMGPGVGVKNADPTMQVVMGGLAAPTPDYVKGMIDWCRQNRGYKADGKVNLCWDVINYHLYSNDAGTSQGGNSTRGAAPEVSDAGQVAKSFVQMAHQLANDMPVWITETGYDLNQGSPLKAIAIGNRSALETQADWTLRTALAYARWGVERVFLYQLYDDNAANPTQFGSMGLLNSNKTPRPAAQYLSQANKLIGAYTYKETLNQDPIVDRYELNGQSAYMLVVPDERGRTAQYKLNLGSATYADVYRPTVGRTTMASQRINLQNGQLTIQVTETPVFVLSAGSPTTTTPSACSATGTILREEWSNANGWAVANIPVQNAPNSISHLSLFESSHNSSNHYGARVRGYLCPPQSGAYTFWIAGDDNCELWLSIDDNPANKVRIASVSGFKAATASREWNKYATQQSVAIKLTGGQRYYIEALHKELEGQDYLAVAWRLPDGTVEGPIPGSRLSSFVTTATRANNAVSLISYDTVKTESNTSRAAVIKDVKLTASPNPFNSDCYIQVELAQTSQASLIVYDVQGRLMQELFSGKLEANATQKFVLKRGGLPTGVYNIQLTTNTAVIHKRVILAN